ncbi:TetR/AcrR family transcriptional regulator [Mycobacterium parmense]|uniref:TetR family transcriptional regulator n=1 Tax=Mycobacterium parmense TaxID=185642 RepID=A0A7I7YNS8_9MYCO|nr:TetR/AcrR family transcriptional regulator [Mycobacterium parmense]MCV7353672.1 TetR/AcrR family transcriptional regulator [Mycobacterium parmense]ORW61196.1 TetR family transcriptional regulator [Mycobacterium parmense]BBZ43460.1 TetR family transcriptional regulator [Mycobacterium parmense]
MRRHGWSGALPSSDDEAIRRIIAAASRAVDDSGPDIRITDIARELGVTRQTVYRYFPTTDALLAATALSQVGPYLDRIAAHCKGIHDPAEAVVEGIAHTLEQLPRDKYLGLLLSPEKAASYSASVTSDVALSLGRSIVDRFDVDWDTAGITEDRRDGLVEFMLRILQSFIVDPGRPPRSPAELRDYLRQWVAPAIAYHRPTVPEP